MGQLDQRHSLDDAFERIEATILPSISMMLEALLDASAQGRSEIGAQAYAAELRTIALHLEALTRQVEAISPCHIDPNGYRSAA